MPNYSVRVAFLFVHLAQSTATQPQIKGSARANKPSFDNIKVLTDILADIQIHKVGEKTQLALDVRTTYAPY